MIQLAIYNLIPVIYPVIMHCFNKEWSLSSLKFHRELGFSKSYVSFSTPPPPSKFKPWHTNWRGEQSMSSTEDSCQGTGVMDKFMFILNTGTNGQDERGGQKWTNLKGKMPQLIYQAERRKISEMSVRSKTTFLLWKTSSNITYEMGKLNRWTCSKNNHVPGKANI